MRKGWDALRAMGSGVIAPPGAAEPSPGRAARTALAVPAATAAAVATVVPGAAPACGVEVGLAVDAACATDAPETGGMPARAYHSAYGSRVPFIDLSAPRPAAKSYPDAELLRLPFPPRARTGFHGDGPDGVADLLALAYGVTRVDWHAEGIAAGRPVPSGGAAYPAELYLAAGFGLCHYLPTAHALERLETADLRREILDCLEARPANPPELVFLITARHRANLGIFGAAGHRLQALDAGVLAGQGLALAEAAGAETFVHTRFDAARLGALLGLDPAEESVRVLITAGAARGEPAAVPAFSTDPGALHAGLPRRIMARRTARAGFEPISVPLQRIHEVLDAAAREIPGDVHSGRGQEFAGLDLYCLAHRVDGLEPACHRRSPNTGELLRVRDTAEPTSLFQAGSAGELAQFQASCALLVVGDYEHGYRSYGERWYRMLNLYAGITAQRIGISATAAGLGSNVRCDYQLKVADRLIHASPERTVLTVVLIGAERDTLPPGHRLLLGGYGS